MGKKLTTEEFIQKAKNIHGNKYDYSETKYVNSKSKVVIICKKHGKFLQQPSNHLQGKGCRKCSCNLSQEEFILRCKKVHGNKYDYSNTIYLGQNFSIDIICPTHGIYKQRAYNHLIGNGCFKCAKNRKLDLAEFIARANKVHNNFYNYNKVNYKNSISKIIIICPIHGEFLQNPQDHLTGYGCTKCSNNYQIRCKKEFSEKFSKIHNNKYDYSLVEYKNNNTKVKIICPIHGIFEQKPRTHLNYGCPKCYNPGYSLDRWVINCNNKKRSKLYIIHCFNKTEEFIKIGITSGTIQSRFRSSLLPYEYKIIKEIDTPPNIAWREEKRLHKLYKSFKYKPLKSFDGQFECFSLDILPFVENSTDLYPLIKYQ